MPSEPTIKGVEMEFDVKLVVKGIISFTIFKLDIPMSEMKNARDAINCEWWYCGLLNNWTF